MEQIDRILVVGAGAMGSQIAMLGALGGMDTVLNDVDPAALGRAEADLRTRMESNVTKGRMTQDAVDAAFERLSFETDLSVAAADAQLVVEAIIEDFEAKVSLFSRLSEVVDSDTIFATNSSSLVASLIGNRTDRPQLTVNMHFFNPPLVMDCVEVVGGEAVDRSVIEAVAAVCERMGRTAVVLDNEIPGFIANRILSAMVREAVSLLEGGYASVAAIDDICRRALRHPMGPFELLDMAGIDVNKQMLDLFYLQSQDPADLPSETIVTLVESHRLGRKTGEGFYRYEDGRKVIA